MSTMLCENDGVLVRGSSRMSLSKSNTNGLYIVNESTMNDDDNNMHDSLRNDSPFEKMFVSRMPEIPELPNGVHILEQTKRLVEMHTVLRSVDTPGSLFAFTCNRLARAVVEYGMNFIPMDTCTVQTPSDQLYEGMFFTEKICGVSIMRSGEAMEKALRDCARSVRIGKVLIQRDDTSGLPQLYYAKFPPDIIERMVLLVDPVLASGLTACKAIDVLVNKAGVPEENIIFLCIIACMKGIDQVKKEYPNVRIVTSAIDEGLNEKGVIVPGLGSFGDRYFGTADEPTASFQLDTAPQGMTNVKHSFDTLNRFSPSVTRRKAEGHDSPPDTPHSLHE